MRINFSKILVTGPQRSGTRIVAKIIAYDNNIRYVDEHKIKIKGGEILDKLLKSNERMVIQCPGLCHRIHEFGNMDLLVVMVIRNIKDIISSQERIGWGKYEKAELAFYGRKNGVISKVKYAYWQEQKKQVLFWVEVKYEDLKKHPLFINKKKRKDFKWNQTELEATA